MKFDARLILAALFAIALTLRADIGSVPFPEDVAAYVGWVLNGVCAGIAILLGPDIADGIKAVLRGKPSDVT